MKNLIILPVLLMFLVLSCDDDTSQKEQYSPFEDPITTDKIDFDGDGRIYYTISAYGHPDEISSSRWTEPDLDIDENLWDMGQGKIHTETGLLVPDFNVLAAYCSSATPLITLYPGWRAETAIAPGTYSIQGVLLDATGTALPLFDASGDLEIDGTDYLPIDVEANPLPANTARLYTLEITSVYTVEGTTYTQVSHMRFAQTWRCPLPGTPLYERILRWGSSWIDDTLDDQSEASENVLAETLLFGMYNLEPLGYRYGPFPRPSDFVDRAEVFLDFPQMACGEFRGFYMALVESQGIDANWLWFWYNYPSSTAPSMYETRFIAALGTDEMYWRYQDHIVVEVNGKVYDPTYLVAAESADEYEDYMFEDFCYGEDVHCGGANGWCTIDDGPQGICVDNLPGYVEGESPPRHRGEDYR